MLERGSAGAGTLVEGVMADIAGRIANRRLVAGARLPSIRVFAAAMGVSKSTVVEAYQRLAAEGQVTPRRGSGFYVADRAVPRGVKPVAAVVDRAVDPYWLMFQGLEAAPGTLMPGSGWLPDSWMPQRAIQRALRELARHPTLDRITYDGPHGYAPLRAQIERRLGAHGIAAPAPQILLVDSGSQALDLVCRFLIEPGDTVIVDDPCYFNFHALLAAHKARIVAVPYTPTGPNLDAFASALAAHKPRLYLTNSACHNPTGATLAPATAHHLLRLAEAHDLYIVEDDVFADLEHEPAPRLAAFDGLRRVIAVGCFSKTISAALRCGFVAARPEWIDSLINLKLAVSFGNGRLNAAFVHRVLVDGSYRRHVEELRTKLASAMSVTLGRLHECGLTPWLAPRAGMLVWARLPDGLDASAIARRALADGVLLAPGQVFSTGPTANAFLRFNVARSTEPRIFEVLRAAMRSTSG